LIARTARQFPLVIALVIALALIPAAFAAKGKPGGGGGGGTGGSNSLSLVMVSDANGDGAPNYNDSVTFHVTSSVTYPSVQTNCYQGGTLVYTHSAGFYPSYPWPWAQTFTLSSTAWTGGAASCTAVLYTMNGKGGQSNLSSISFTAGA
jgi:hypothetical protein